MNKLSRRSVLKGAGALAAAAILPSRSLLDWAEAWAATKLRYEPEKGAKLRLLRWKRWVESEEVAFNANMAAFTHATGVQVRVDNEWIDDVQPKAAVAANIGAGPDLVWGSLAFPHLFPEKLVDLTDLADYLGGKYGGWYPIAEDYGKWRGRWIAIPWCVGGNYINYRASWVKQAGFDHVPDNTDDFLKLCQALKKSGHPPGMALGHSTADGNVWTHWLVWAFGGKLVDKNSNVVINSPQTIDALEYGRELYQTFTPGTASWLDSHNNKAFLAGEIGLTINAISIYAKARADHMTIADDIDHAYLPIGPVGRPMELHTVQPMVVFKYSKYPNAAKALLQFMMESPQYDKWLKGAVAYFSHTLKAFDKHPVWTEDPKRKVFKDAAARAVSVGYAGPLGYAAAASLADFIIVDMVAGAATGQVSPKEAAATAEKRANRYYKV
jgi:multiple sugar transport system substrate-binding protein